MQGIIFDIQHFCLHDGPGIRTVVFLKGCPLRCKWCHNPESHNSYTEIMFSKEKCTRCGNCKNNCLKQDFSLLNLCDCELLKKNECKKCVDACPSGALRLCGETKEVNAILKEVLRDKAFYNHSGGGITLSGGEPLMQPEFSYELLKGVKNEGIHTAIETCGFFDSELILKFHNVTDLWLYDIKLFSENDHLNFTGVKNNVILENLYKLNDLGAKIILRAPIIPKINDNKAHFIELAKLVNNLKNVKRIDLIPYHSLGVSKAEQLGRKNNFMPDTNLLNENLKVLFDFLLNEVRCEVKIQF